MSIWDKAPCTPIDDVVNMIKEWRQMIDRPPPAPCYLYPSTWTNTEIGPLPPGWEARDGKPVRELLAYVHAWRRARPLIDPNDQ